MKKFYMMFAAIITLAAISFVSCGSDDDDNPTTWKKYTVKFEIDYGSLNAEGKAILQQLEQQSAQGEYASDEEAIAQWNQAVAEAEQGIQMVMGMASLASGGVKDFSVTFCLYDSNNKLLKSKKFTY